MPHTSLSVRLTLSQTQTQTRVTQGCQRHVHEPGRGPRGLRAPGPSPGFLLQILQVGLQSVVGGRARFQVRLDLRQLLFGKTEEL